MILNKSASKPKGRHVERLPGLDLVRVLAVYFIILSHSGLSLFKGIGVPFLLALSGFLITKTLISDFEHDTYSIKRFWRNRFLRIAPAYYTFIIAAFVLDNLILGDEWKHNLLIYSVLHSVNYYNAFYGHSSGMVAHLWTLSTMEQFYLLYPLILLTAFKTNHPVKILIGIIAATISWRTTMYLGLLDTKLSIQWIYNSLDTRLDSLLLGSLAAFYLNKRQYSTINLPFYIWPCVFFLGVTALQLSQTNLNFHYTVGYTVEGGFALIVMLAIMKISELRKLTFSNGRVIHNLAKISYPMYLYHPIGLGIGFKVFDQFLMGLLVGTFATIFLAFCSYKIVEKPFMKLRMKKRTQGALR